MSYDMLAFDLDGTTITNTYQMSPSFVELIKEEKKHHYICIATGRSISDAYRYYRLLELETMMICFNGAFIYNPRTKEVLYSKPLEIAPNLNICKIFLDKEVSNVIENVIISSGAHTYFLNTRNQYLYQMLVDDDLPHTRMTVDEMRGKEIYRIVLSVKDDKKSEVGALLEYLKKDVITDKIEVYPWKSHSEIVDISVGNVDKWNALRKVCEHEGLSTKKIISIGDGVNDINMLQNSLMGICMKNAADNVKRKARYITAEDNNNNGAYIALVELLGLSQKLKSEKKLY